jgi:hypothetical protein
VKITDRDKANTDKSRQLMAKLPSTRGAESGSGISAETEDIFAEEPAVLARGTKYDVLTAVGILEYLQGFTCETTERCLDLEHADDVATAPHLAERLGSMATDAASLIVNTCRPHASTRILELFGRRFDYRNRENLSELLATANFLHPRVVGSGNIYDIVVYTKSSP